MINLRVRTEYSFHEAYGPLDKVIAAAGDEPTVSITDRHGTWGHVQFFKAAKKAGKKAILGVELAVVADMDAREKQASNYMAFLARNNEGLSEVYRLTSLAASKFYYTPRIDYSTLHEISDNVVVLSGSTPEWGLLPRKKNIFIELSPTSSKKALVVAQQRGFRTVATSDNHFPRAQDKEVYEIIAGKLRRQMRTSPMHLLTEHEWGMMWDDQSALETSREIAEGCSVDLPQARIPRIEALKSLEEMCREAAPKLRIDLSKAAYAERLARELALIAEKDFADYFYIVADLVAWAKKHMLVGPARGSSCGSLVCYLLRITDIDPIPFDLLFERFIDINRKDLPDIDIDFPDDKRDMVFKYLSDKYGKENVARLGTVSRYGAKSTISDVAKELNIPLWEVSDLKNAIIERSSGDARASFCILDTFNDLEIGRKVMAKYPQLKIAADVENHASHTGIHAAGVVITSEPIQNFCALDKDGIAMVDKVDAESIGLLKIDALGLRNLSIIQDTLDQIGWSREKIVSYPLNDQKAFDVLNDCRFSGVFQFEGNALQSLSRQVHIEDFEDIASLTALARPGPLISGGANVWVKRRSGNEPIKYLHPIVKAQTEVTKGIIVYQEQVMQIARDMGKMSWEDVSSLRKAMSKSLGKEFFNQYMEKFIKGAAEHGVSRDDAINVWENINTMGSWSFNRSHAVAYGMVSYWTLVLKAHFPLEFAAASLRNPKDDDQCTKLLRELSKEGFQFKPYDKELSEKTWSVKAGQLIGGLINIKGVGEKMAEEILKRRKANLPLQPRHTKLLEAGKTPFDSIFECRERFGHIIADPAAHNIKSKIVTTEEISGDENGMYVFFGRIKEKNLRDHNEPILVQKRGGREMKGQTLFLNLTLEDDTGIIMASIDRFHYLKMGKPIIENAKLGDWYIWRGKVKKGWRRVSVEKYRCMEEKKDG